MNTQNPGTTQELKPPRKQKSNRFLRILLNFIIFLAVIAVGVFGGYQSGIAIRKNAEEALLDQQLSDQFARAITDIQFGNYEAARTRLEYIIGKKPTFPGAMEKLTEIMVLTSIPTVTPVVSPTPELIVDETNYEALFIQAQQLIAAGQWQNAMTVVSVIRKNDPTYRTVQIDGMYYFALRNLGVELIKAGNLEGGIYELTLAERFEQLDNTAHILRDNARTYINASSFWELDWKRAAEGFYYLNGSGIWDGTMTGTERYRIAAMRYGDQLFEQGQYCPAYEQYEGAQSAGKLDEQAARNANEAHAICYPPTAAATATGAATQPPPTSPPPTTPPPTTPPPTAPPTPPPTTTPP